MNDFNEPVTGSTGLLSTENIALLYDTARMCEDPVARLVEIAVMGPWCVTTMAKVPVRYMDRKEGYISLPTVTGSYVEVALGFEAASVIDRIVGSRREGPLVSDPGGLAIAADKDAEEYAFEVLGDQDERTLPIGWTFRLIRESVFADMVDNGVPLHVATAQAGLQIGHVPIGCEELLFGQRAAADWWSYRLGIRPPAPFVLIDAIGRGSIRRPRPGGA